MDVSPVVNVNSTVNSFSIGHETVDRNLHRASPTYMRGKQCQNSATRHLSRRVTTSSGGGVRTELEGAETVWREDLNGIGGGINVASEDALFLCWRGLYVIFLALEEPLLTYWNRHS